MSILINQKTGKEYENVPVTEWLELKTHVIAEHFSGVEYES